MLDRLSEIAHVIAVHGNADTPEAQRELPYQQLASAAGRRILLCHSHHPDLATEMASRRDDAWEPKLARWSSMSQRVRASVFVFGHTHVPMARRRDGVLPVTPGAIASPRRGKSRTFLNLTILAGSVLSARGATRLAYYFEGTDPPRFFEPPRAPDQPSRQYRNPIVVAKEWHSMLAERACVSRAELARKLGVSRARVTQVLGLLDLAPQVLEAVVGLGDPLPRPAISERMLRPLLNWKVEEQ